MRGGIFIGLILAALAGQAPGQSVVPLSDKVEDTFKEASYSRASDAFLARFHVRKAFVGVHLVGQSPAPLDYEAFVLGPLPSVAGQADQMQVCVSIRSLDTLYDGVINFGVKPSDKPPTANSSGFGFSSDHQERLRQDYDSGNIVIRALMTRECRSQDEGYLVAAGVEPDPFFLEVIHVASEGNLQLSMVGQDNEMIEPDECIRIETPPGQRCRFELARLQPGDYELNSIVFHVAHPQPIIRTVTVAVPDSSARDD